MCSNKPSCLGGAHSCARARSFQVAVIIIITLIIIIIILSLMSYSLSIWSWRTSVRIWSNHRYGLSGDTRVPTLGLLNGPVQEVRHFLWDWLNWLRWVEIDWDGLKMGLDGWRWWVRYCSMDQCRRWDIFFGIGWDGFLRMGCDGLGLVEMSLSKSV